jgi:aminoglycoside phosphotransferase (APT) family kinase protein
MSAKDEIEAEAEAEAARQAATAVLTHRFGAPDLVSEQGGVSNHVFRARAGNEIVVARVGDVTKREAFERERLVTSHVRQAGVPAPEVLLVEERDGFAVMILRALPGEIARDHPHRLRTLKELGALAAQRVHTLRTSGFGCDFNFGVQPAAGTWRDWVLREFDAQSRLDVLANHHLVSGDRLTTLQQTLDRVLEWSADPVLNHGDLRLKNVLVDSEGAIVGLIDWETCLSAPGPHWDISVALHDLWVDQIEAFFEGYGMASEDVREHVPVWRLFNALNYVAEVEHAANTHDEDALERIRVRFSGVFDLFGGR